MKILINGKDEILNVGSVAERLRGNNSAVLDIGINDSDMTVEKLGEMFSDVEEIEIVRTDLDGEEHSVVFIEYTQIDKIQRRIGDETDITVVSLVKGIKNGEE